MISKAWIFALVTTGLLVGCATDMRSGGDGARLTYTYKNCPSSGPCTVTVTVPASCMWCKPSVDFDFVRSPQGQHTRFIWTLATSGYKFDPRNGIDFPGDPQHREFPCHPEGESVYVCEDTHGTTGVYKYTINVNGPGSPRPLDPWVINE